MKSENLNDIIDFQFAFSKEMINDNGEDSFYSEIVQNRSVLAVFDGCGGLGSKEYDNFNGKTGAYMAARIVSGVTRKWFLATVDSSNTETYKSLINKAFEIAHSHADKDTIVIKGSMQKLFPTTLSLAICETLGRSIQFTFIWAGDSRGYILDEDGLHQITQDDINDEDAMSNLSNDGVLTNIVHFGGKYNLHLKKVTLKKPGIVFCATDGCFGYLSTPMEFENILLETLSLADSPINWKNRLITALGAFACDDYTLALLAIGYNDFSKLKKSFKKRLHDLQLKYIQNISEKTYLEKVELWKSYKSFYENY